VSKEGRGSTRDEGREKQRGGGSSTSGAEVRMQGGNKVGGVGAVR